MRMLHGLKFALIIFLIGHWVRPARTPRSVSCQCVPVAHRRRPETLQPGPDSPSCSAYTVAGRRQVGCLFYFIGRLLALDSTTWVSAFDGPPGQALRREGAPAPPPPLECKA